MFNYVYTSDMSSAQRGFRVNFLSSINSTAGKSYKCMAVHPIHPLLVVCDDSENIYLHRINADQPHLIHSPLFHLGEHIHASCIAFHSTLPIVAASSDETNLITFWNIQDVIDRSDEVPFNVEERRKELEQMLSQLGDASELEELEEELDELNNYAGTKLNSFATVTTVNPSYITFHPTMPYIVVGCIDYESSFSTIYIIQADPRTSRVEVVNSINIPLDEDDTYKKIESIVFSHDGVFLAVPFNDVIIVWFFSPTEEMKKLMELRIAVRTMGNDVKSLFFSPRDYILVAGIGEPRDGGDRSNIIGSFKIEKANKSMPIPDKNLTTVEGWTATVADYHPTKASISTLAFHPTLPLLVCGFINGDVKYYAFDSDDHLSELTRVGFKNPIPFQDRIQPSVALNRKFLVTCDSDEVRVYHMDGVESAVYRFGDKLRDMSMAARKSLYRKGIPEGVRELILNKTSYGNSLKGSIAFLKTRIDKKRFLDLIRDSPLWLLGIIQQFIDLLKLTPNLPPILIPFQAIITLYYPLSSPDAEYKQTCNGIVERFITENKINPKSAVVKKIKDFFNSVVNVLCTHRVNLRKDIQNTFIKEIFPILQELFTLNQSETNHRFIRDIDLKELLEYDQADREFTRKHNEEHKQGGRKKKTRARTYKKKRTRARHGFH